MVKTLSDQSASRPVESGTPETQLKPKDATRPASQPQGTLDDQVKTMESEGQAQPQEGDRTPEELEREKRERR
jgi:hypothetical protein